MTRLRAAIVLLLAAAAVPPCEGREVVPAQAAAAAAAGTQAAPSSAVLSTPWPHRIIAVGDLHGDLAHTRESLRLVGVIDASDHWAAGNATFVQIGDVMDRGDDVRAVLDLLRRLEREAAAAGGRSLMLIGNHETYSLTGDQASASARDMASFGGEEARRQAFSRTGDYGAWLRTQKAVVVVDDTVFVHGGLTPDMARHGIDAVNAGVLAYLDGESPSPFVDRRSGPMYFRGYVSDPASDACVRLDEALQFLGARRMVVGHTPSDDGLMLAPCGGHLVDVDTGISESFGVHTSTLEIANGDAWAVYPGGRIDLPDPR
jgi:hypothetical protein